MVGRRLNQCGRSSSLLWRSLSPLLGRDRDVAGNTDHTADSFAEFFDKKVLDVLSATARLPGLTFDCFRQSLKTHLFGDRSA